MRTVKLIIALIISSLCVSSWASSMMQASVAVTDHSPVSLKKVLPTALSDVLVKLSGNASVMTLPSVQNEVPHINDIVESYSYSMQAPNAASAPMLMANITFNKKAITALLNNAGQPVWGADRPVTLVWLDQVDGLDHANFIGSADQATDPMALAMSADAKARGLELMFPMMDLTDQSDVGDDPSNIFSDHHLSLASKRYGTQSVLSGKVVQSGNQWEAHWKYVLDGAPIEWDDTASSLNQLALNAVNAMAGSMISQLAMASPEAPTNMVVLSVSGISDLGQYARVQKYLTALGPVNSVSLQGVNANGMMLKVQYSGTEDVLKQAIVSKPQMQVDMTAVANLEGPPSQVLAYHWQGASVHG
jgi:uncharacterized protein